MWRSPTRVREDKGGELALISDPRGPAVRADTAQDAVAQDAVVLDAEAMDAVVHELAASGCNGVLSSVNEFLDSQRSVARASFLGRLFGRPPVPRSLRAQYRVARGDVRVFDVLSQLGPDWLVRTCEPESGSGVEHVLIGPSGIFCMIVRHQPGGAIWIDGGVLLVDGERLPHLRDAESRAVKLTQALSDAIGSRVEASPCLVLVGPRSLTVAKPPRRVAVMMSRDIRTWLRGLPRVLSNEELEILRTSAAVNTECQTVGAIESPSARALVKFRKVQAEMGQARHVRLTWVTGALLLLWLIAVVGIGGVTTSFLVG